MTDVSYSEMNSRGGYPHKTIYDNLANALKIAKVDKDTIDRKVKEAAKLLEIEHLLERRPHELSGGQKQRTAIGRAIVREPELFLFDEPIAHLDAALRAHMRSELKILQRKLGTTMIYVTHDQLEALSMADRIAVMRDGVLQQLATPSEIYNNPANKWVASFIGEPKMNFVDCDIIESDGNISLKSAAFEAPVLEEQAALIRANAKGRQVSMGIRPDDISFAANGTAPTASGEVLITELLGGDMLVEAQLQDSRVTVKTKPDYPGQEGENCALVFDKSRWHVFSGEDGSAIF